MRSIVDRAVGFVAGEVTRRELRSPSVVMLARIRESASESTLSSVRSEALALAAAMDGGEAGASEAYGELAERALRDMRARVLEHARSLPGRLTARAHAGFGATDEQEYLDDPDLDPTMRVRLLDRLDHMNRQLGNYRAFFSAIQPVLRPGQRARVLDLAAGHGGFALEVARMARARGLAIEMTATDLRQEYLALGEAIGAREQLDVRFMVQDALDLTNLEPGAYDLIVCTQSLHHFPASMTARMFREAARAASRGVVFIDGCRSMMHGALIGGLARWRYQDREFAHDAWVSFRRFYCPEELGLLARLGPEADRVTASWMAPGHCLVRYSS